MQHAVWQPKWSPAMQSTNPLGKCVEHLQEDLESMAAEQRFWQAEYQTYQVRPAHQRSALCHSVCMPIKAPVRLCVPDNACCPGG